MVNFDNIKLWYDYGIWTVTLVQIAERDGFLTHDQMLEILGDQELPELPEKPEPTTQYVTAKEMSDAIREGVESV